MIKKSVVKRRPVSTSKDIESREKVLEKKNETMQKEIERKPRKTVMQVMDILLK